MDKSKIAVEVFDKQAKKYQDKFMNVDSYGASFDLFCASIKKENADILELACGPGNITKYLLKKRPDFNILATDLAPKMLELGKVNVPQAKFQLLDCRDIITLEKTYDAIMCGFCLPYLSKEESVTLIRDAAKVLRPGGVIYISTMEDDYSTSGFKTGSSGDQIYMHYHEAEYLTNALKECGFEIVNLTRQEYPEQDESTTIDLLIIAKK